MEVNLLLKQIAVELTAIRETLEDGSLRPRRVILRRRRRFRSSSRYMMQGDIEEIARRVVESLAPNPHLVHDLARRIVSLVRSPGTDDEKIAEVAQLLRGEKSEPKMELLRQLTEAGNRINELEAAHNVLTDNYYKVNQQRQELRLALEAAVRVLRAWYRPGAFGAHLPWDLHYRNAPELAAVRAVLGPEWKP